MSRVGSAAGFGAGRPLEKQGQGRETVRPRRVPWRVQLPMETLDVTDTASWHDALRIRQWIRRTDCAIPSGEKIDAKPVGLPRDLSIHEYSPISCRPAEPLDA